MGMNKKLNDLVILVKGAGEMATGVAHRLASCHLKVCMTETSEPQAVRREVAFSEAVFDQEKLGDIDPRDIKAHCYSISDKARTISGGVLQAILGHFNG
jgi:cytosine/adenosine deaminase-related metal-dependent hydrolase